MDEIAKEYDVIVLGTGQSHDWFPPEGQAASWAKGRISLLTTHALSRPDRVYPFWVSTFVDNPKPAALSTD